MSRIKLLLIWLLLALPLWAAPAITPGSLSGTMSSGESVTISGSGFGAKSTAAPIKWDNFEGGSDENTIANGWTAYGNSSTYEADGNRTGSSLCYQAYSVHEGGEDTPYYNNYIKLEGLSLTDKVFISLWMKYNWGTVPYDGGVSSQVKHGFRVSNVYPLGTSYANMTWYNIPGHNPYVQTATGNDYGVGSGHNLDTWIQFEVELQQCTPDVADGKLHVWKTVSGTLTNVLNSNTAKFRSGSDNWAHVSFQNYTAGGALSLYYDDIYIDNTWQRVVLGDSATYTSCTKREIQIPTAWNDTGITFTVNQGSFSAGDTAYLYVIDADGVVSDGYDVTIGSSSPSTPSLHGVSLHGVDMR